MAKRHHFQPVLHQLGGQLGHIPAVDRHAFNSIPLVQLIYAATDSAALQAAAAMTDHVNRVSQLAEVNYRIGDAQRRLAELDCELVTLDAKHLNEAEVAKGPGNFDDLWNTLSPRVQSRVLQLLIARIEFDGEQGNISLMFHSSGVKVLAAQMATERENVA